MMAKRYYWLKLQRDFFKRHDIRIIEDMENGKDYILFYLKMLVESIDHEGMLRFSDTIPYNDKMLSTITNTNIDIVRAALKIFSELGMLEILDDSTIYMCEVEKMIGSAADNDNAKRQQRLRDRKKSANSGIETQSVTKSNASVTECVTKNNESKSIELDIDKEKDIELDTDNPPISPLPGESESWNYDKHTNVENTEYELNGFEDFCMNHSISKKALLDWMEYKDQRKPRSANHYSGSKSIASLIRKVESLSSEYGDNDVAQAIEDSMGNNYQGIVWDYLLKNKSKPQQGIDWSKV